MYSDNLTPDAIGVSVSDLRKLPKEQLDLIGLRTIGANPQNVLMPYILGLAFDCVLFGVCMMQVGRWFQYGHKEEGWVTRVIVYWCTLSSAGITVYLIANIFKLFVVNYGHYFQFLDVDFGSSFYIIDLLVQVPVSAFFIHRAWRLSGKKYILLCLLTLLLIGSMAFGITARVLSFEIYGQPLFDNIIIATRVNQLVCDAIITISITIALLKSKTGWSHTDRMVKKLVSMTAETMLPPTIVTMAFMITFLATAGSTWGFIFVFSTKVYFICLLVVLNMKVRIRREMESSGPSRDHDNTYALESRPRNPAVVHVLTETFRDGQAGSDLDDKANMQSPADDLESQHTNVNDGPGSFNEMEYKKNTSQVQLRPMTYD